ncbi:amidohydrolase [Lutibacter sp.]|uniref:amidohydrolase n=1 Tax=Lutibacter sp. TaxID=1925666 RepID=UPI00273645C7|nr:amidohydrolase [Lutibacter sp.]MDP3314363.1 amidohydrolase [Lutibacter sp.]
MKNTLNIAIIQSNLVWEQPKKNRSNFSTTIESISKEVDLFVLPEMFTSGFTMNPQHVAETMQGETVEWMRNLALKKNAAIAGSIIIIENNNFYNRLLFVHPSGEINYYNKRHLFSLAGEHLKYTTGTEKLIVNYNDWKICPLVCYDLRFPVWSRNVENYDVLLYVANWPKPRIAAWDALLKARSIENLSYVIGVNRVGVDENHFEYSGHSVAYNCLGKKLTHLKTNQEDNTIITLHKKHIAEVRTKLNFLNDKDSFEIK